MKYILIFYLFNGQAGITIKQDFSSESKCQDAKTVMMATAPAGASFVKGYCFPL